MHETTNRCNGHIQVSSAGKGSKRDRKGCKKGKIEAIMKNNMGSTKPKLHIDTLFSKKKPTKMLNSLNRCSSGGMGDEIIGITPGSVIKSEIIDDPYTFTDCESSQNISLYLTANSVVSSGSSSCLIKKEQTGQLHLNNMHQLTGNQLSASSIITNNSIISNSKNNSDSPMLSNCSDNSTHNNSTSSLNASVLTNSVTNKAVTSLSTSYNKFSSGNRNNLYVNAFNSNKLLNSSNCGSSNSNKSVNNINNMSSNVNNINTSSGVSNSQNCIDNTWTTMNRLQQADIARNKVVVKKRKMLNQPTPSSKLLTNSSSHTHGDNSRSGTASSLLLSGSNVYGSTAVKCEPGINARFLNFKQPQQLRTLAKVSIPAKRMHRQTTWQRERRIRHEALQRIHEAQCQLADIKRDLFPLGLDISESDEDDVNWIDNESDEVFQRHWFMGYGAGDQQNLTISIRGRESRLTQLRNELRRRIRQVCGDIAKGGEPPSDFINAVVAGARTQPAATAMLIGPHQLESVNNTKLNRAKVSMLDVKQCSLCQRKALPCTRHCTRHIMYNVDQLLFEYCTGKLDDKTQCRVPVFDIAHQLPLCPQHAKKRDNNVKIFTEVSSKKSRKKSKTSTLARSAKRGKKKKKKPSSVVNNISSNIVSSSIFSHTNDKSIDSLNSSRLDDVDSTADDDIANASIASMMEPLVSASTASNISVNVPVNDIIHGAVVVPQSHTILSSVVASSPTRLPVSQVEIQVQLEDVVEEVPEEVLAIASSLDPAELVSQTGRLLDQDLSNMLNLPADAFNDLFTEDKNGEYEPTREETEELERALEAVDKDVRSLERMTLSLPALPLSLPLPLETMTTLLDDPAVTSALPGVYSGVGFPNGFTSSVQTDLRHS